MNKSNIEIEAEAKYPFRNHPHYNACQKARREAYIQGRQDEREDQQWIKVKDCLPEPGDNVLVHIETGNIRMGILDTDMSTWLLYYSDGRHKLNEEIFVTHWQPLPEPPVKEP